MSRRGPAVILTLCALAGLAFLVTHATGAANDERLLRLRTLGKAFYENPTTQHLAVEQFKQARELNPSSAVDRLNYGLALIRAGQVKEGIAELEAVQKADPSIPHTWFNLGIEYKKLGDTDRAIAQLEQMAKMVPDEPITQYNLGVMYKAAGRTDNANAKFELAASLDPNFAAPHFQLFNFYRQSGKTDESKRELAAFQDLKRRHDESGTGNEDVEWSLYSEILETIDPGRSGDSRPAAGLRFASAAPVATASATNARLSVFDLEGDGAPDLLAASQAGIAILRKGATPAPQPTLAGLKDVLAAALGDFDNDGLADLCVVTPAGPAVFHNEKGVFRKAAIQLPAGSFNSAIWLDYDHDYDLDLLLLGARPALLRNQAEAGFTDRTADVPFQSGEAVSAVVFRLIPDTKSHDLLVIYKDKPAVLYRDRLGGKFDPIPMAAVPANATGITAADLDNDGAADLLWQGGAAWNRNGKFTAGNAPANASFTLADFENRGLLDVLTGGTIARNGGAGKFTPTNAAGIPAAGSAALAAADFDGDGKTDIAAIAADGKLTRYLNQTPLTANWTRVRINGVKNLKLAPGSEVEIKSGAFYQKKTYEGVPLLFGLRTEKEIDTIRITWPNGLIQNETKQKANTPLVYQEAQRLSGSCPVVWTWNGRGFEYITDVLGVAPLGVSSGDGRSFPTDHDEYVWIDGRSLQPNGGRLDVRITEELSEVSYIDQVELIAVDHPAQASIFTNEKWKSPPFPDFRLYGGERRVYPVHATEDAKTVVTDRLLRRDRRHPDSFSRNMLGVASMHSLDLDFGAAAASNRAVLVLYGWVDWADGSTFLQQAQASPQGLVPPQLQVKNSRGEWVTVIEDMGMPSGKPKSIAIDLTGKFMSASREVRILTNLCAYWDEAFLIEDSAAPTARLTTLAANQTDLRFRGFSQNRIHPERKQPEEFSYDNPRPVSMWNPTPGHYTRYGPVTPLVNKVDDKLIVMGSGDELHLSFDARALPPLPEGWRRDWILKVDGWEKDRDANTALSQTVEPLPFHGMSAYPYPASENPPDSPEYREYKKQYNTRPALRLLRALNETGTRSDLGQR